MPKSVRLKYTSRLQTVSKRYQGWRGVANKGTSPRACGWEAYLPHALTGEAARGISRSHIGNSSAGPHTLVNKFRRLFYKVPFRGMFRLRYASLNMTQLNLRKQNFFPISVCTTRAFGAHLRSFKVFGKGYGETPFSKGVSP